MLATLTSGNGAGSVDLLSAGLGVDGYGAFGSSVGGAATEDALLTIADGSTTIGTVFQSAVAIGIGSDRHYLASGAMASSSALTDPTTSVNGSNTIATSEFTLPNLGTGLSSLAGLEFDLEQEMVRLDGNIGSMLIQTYTITNATSSAVAFDLYRYIDPDIDGIDSNGGGRIITSGQEVLFTTRVLADLDDDVEFVAITGEGGTIPTSNRFEVDEFPGLRNRIDNGTDLDDIVTGDFDSDGVIDSPYDVTNALRNSFSLAVNESVTYVTRTIWGLGANIDEAFDPPKVTEVTISGSASTHTPYAFSTVVGDGDQIRTVPVGGADTISVTFSESVDPSTLNSGTLTVQSRRTGDFYSLNYVGLSGNTATWELASGMFPADQLTIAVDDSVTDLSGFHLDGEWDNPCALTDTGTSVFPSGDDLEGGDFQFYATTMPGDANRDNIVNGLDTSILSANFGQSGKNWSQADFTGDGHVGSSDLSHLSANFNKDFTACPTAPQVTEVTVSGSSSTHAAYAFSTVDGDGDQVRTVPVGGADTISVTFSESVNSSTLNSSTLTVQSRRTGNFYSLNYVGLSGSTATWRLASGTFGADQLTISLNDSVTDLGGVHLDGEWDNPCALADAGTSVFPSGDGVAGGDFEFFLTTMPGDANRDNIVNSLDTSILSANFGQSGKNWSQADFTGDGHVGSNDLSHLSANFNKDFTACPIAPQVIEVTVSGSASTHAAHAFSSADGSGEQLRTIPVGGANVIAIQFSEDVTIAQSNLRLIALNRVVSEPAVTSFVEPSSGNGFTATWTFASVLPAAQYLISLSDGVVDLGGVALDGEWTNPTQLTSTGSSTFPSGDDLAGGDFEFVLTVLPGDANRDNIVNSLDTSILSANFGQSGKNWSQADFTGDGHVGSNDLSHLSGNFNFDWRTLDLLGDFDGNDYDVDELDEDDFLALYNSLDSDADLNGDSQVNQADFDAFYEQFNFGIDIDVAA